MMHLRQLGAFCVGLFFFVLLSNGPVLAQGLVEFGPLLDEARDAIDGQADGAFGSGYKDRALLHKIDVLGRHLRNGDRQGALNKLRNDILPRLSAWFVPEVGDEVLIAAARDNLMLVVAILDPGGPEAQALAARQRYFMARPDYRRCISPLCGGYWVEALNWSLTRCADGSWQDECYVAEIDWDNLGFGSTQTDDVRNAVTAGEGLLRGRLSEINYPGFAPLGFFTPADAWLAATSAPPTGNFSLLSDNGIVCITWPCFTVNQQFLNQSRRGTISDIDLSGVGADPADEQAAFTALRGDGFIVAGWNVSGPVGPAGVGETVVATQFYMLEEADTNCFPMRTLDQGATSYMGYPGFPGDPNGSDLMILNQADMDDFWRAHTAGIYPAPPVPFIDWSTELVYVTIMGARPTGGYSTNIECVSMAPLNTVRVHVTDTSPGPDCIVTQAFTNPYHIVAAARVLSLGLHFEHTRVEDPCR